MQNLIDFKKNVNAEIGMLLEDSMNNCISELNSKEVVSLSTLVV